MKKLLALGLALMLLPAAAFAEPSVGAWCVAEDMAVTEERNALLNQALEDLKNSLDDMIDLLNPGGRICVITFHSLEDRIVKNTMKRLAAGCTCPKDFPVCVCGKAPEIKMISRKPILPSKEEQKENPRSKSAKLRIIEKI